MEKLTKEVGKNIKSFRKKKGMTLQELAKLLCKSKATVSKYENGQIAVDIVTLYEVARALDIHVDQLLYSETTRGQLNVTGNVPSFFRGLTQFYLYFYDGRSRTLQRYVVDVMSKTKENAYKLMVYANIESYENYYNCETTYWGYLNHYDALSNMILYNQDTPMEQVTVSILASYLDAPTKWGLLHGISSRPLMPVAAKVLLSKKILNDSQELERELRISREDIRTMKQYNMFTVAPNGKF